MVFRREAGLCHGEGTMRVGEVHGGHNLSGLLAGVACVCTDVVFWNWRLKHINKGRRDNYEMCLLEAREGNMFLGSGSTWFLTVVADAWSGIGGYLSKETKRVGYFALCMSIFLQYKIYTCSF